MIYTFKCGLKTSLRNTYCNQSTQTVPFSCLLLSLCSFRFLVAFTLHVIIMPISVIQHHYLLPLIPYIWVFKSHYYYNIYFAVEMPLVITVDIYFKTKHALLNEQYSNVVWMIHWLYAFTYFQKSKIINKTLFIVLRALLYLGS